jgi:hypothetical protein
MYFIVLRKGTSSTNLVRVEKRTPAQFLRLADVPPEEEWLANITNPKTRRAYKADVREFVAYAGLGSYAELRAVVRAHVIDWRKDMERRELGAATIRRKLSAFSSLFDYLCDRNAVAGNPVDGVKRPMANANEGSTPSLGARYPPLPWYPARRAVRAAGKRRAEPAGCFAFPH